MDRPETNAVVGQYYRSVAEVDAHGHIRITEGNAYSGDNGRAAIKGHGLYYMVGNGDQGAELKCPPESSRSRLGVILRLSGMAFGAQFQDAAE